VISAAQEVRHPAASYIVRFQRGQNHPGWEQAMPDNKGEE
jgi:hypothetical protein